MGKAGLQAAADHGKQLPIFRTLADARQELFALRAHHLAVLSNAAEGRSPASLDRSPESLKPLEAWYFQLLDTDSFGATGPSRAEFERGLPFYFGEVLARIHPPFEWIVEESAFAPERYEIGVRRGLITVMLTLPWDLSARPHNKRRLSMWRQFCQYAA
jgi:hypothetical protein